MNRGTDRGRGLPTIRIRRAPSEALKRARRRLAIEQLEGRQLLAYSTLASSYSVNGSDVGSVQVNDSGAANTSLVITVDSNGYLMHTGDGNTGSGKGKFASALDWDSSTAGTQVLKAAGSSLIVDSQDGTDTVTIGSPTSPASADAASIEVHNSGTSTLVVDDSANASAATYSYDGDNINYPGGGTVDVWDTQTGGITLKGGSGGDTFNVSSTNAGETFSILGGAGNDAANVQGNSAQVNVDLAGGSNTATVANVHSMTGILANVDVKATGGTAALTLDAGSDELAGPVNITNAQVSGMATGNVTYDATVTALNLDGPTDVGLTFNLESSAVGTTTAIYAGDNSSTPTPVNDFVVGVGGSTGMSDILGPVYIKGGTPNDVLDLNDASHDSAATYSLDGSKFTRTGAFGAVGLNYSGVSTVNLHAGDSAEFPGNNTINLNGTEDGATTNLYAGSGDDTVNVNGTAATGSVSIDTGAGTDVVNVLGNSTAVSINSEGTNTVNVGKSDGTGTMQGIGATVSIDGADGGTALNLNDQADTTGRTVTSSAACNSGTISGMSPGDISLDTVSLSGVTFNGGSGGNTFNIDGTVPVVTTTLNSGTGADTINVPKTATGSTLAINGQGATDRDDRHRLRRWGRLGWDARPPGGPGHRHAER